jgi:hypothetical protein
MLRLASLRRRRLREPSEQSCCYGYVLACSGKAWKAVIVLNDSPMHVTGPSVHLVMVLCNLILEHRTLLLQIESRGFELPLLLLQLAHTRVGRDLHVYHSPMPIGRMWGSLVFPLRGTIVGTNTASLRGCLSMRVISDLRHEIFTRGVVAPVAGGRIRDCL